MRNLLTSLMLVGLTWLTPNLMPAPAVAAEMKPIAVLALTSYDQIRGDLDFLGQMSGTPELAQSFDGIVAFATQFQGLIGLDKSKPWCVALMTNGDDIRPYGMLPVTDAQKLYGVLTAFLGEPEEIGEKRWKIEKPKANIFIREHEGWAYITMAEKHLDDLPGDPLKVVGSLTETYDLALRLNAQNVPVALREQAIDQLKQGAQQSIERRGEDLTDEQREQIEQVVDMVAAAIMELDELTLGWSLDSKGKRAFFDVALTFIPGGEFAKKQAEQAVVPPSAFGGILFPEGMFTAHVSEKIAAEDQEVLHGLIETGRAGVARELERKDSLNAEDKETLMEITESVFDVLDATVDAGVLNAGLAVVGNGPLNIVLALKLEDAETLEQAFQDGSELIDEGANAPGVKLDVGEHAGVVFHELSGPIADREAKQVFGSDTLRITFGFGENAVYLGVGSKGQSLIEQVIDGSAKAAPPKLPAELTLSLLPLLEFSATVSKDEERAVLLELCDSLKATGKGHIRLTSQFIELGASSRLEIEEGVLKLLGVAVKYGREQAMRGRK